MEFYTQWKRPKKVYVEINSGEIRVEKAGYISAQKRIENLILAGQRLVKSRSESYDFNGEPDLEYVDISRSKNVDIVDIDHATEYLETKAKKASKDLTDKAKKKDVQKEDIDQELQEAIKNQQGQTPKI